MKKRRVKKLAVFISIFIVIGIITGAYYLVKNIKLPQDQKEKPQELTKDEDDISINKLSLLMVGDVLIHSSLYKEAMVSAGKTPAESKYDFAYMFKEVKDRLKGYDLKFYNQESIIGGKSLGMSSYPMFNSPDEIGDVMLDMGFNLVALANNHTMDKGEKGVLYSSNYWASKKDVVVAGSYSSEEDRLKSRIGEMNGIKYALLSYTTVTNGLTPPKGKEYLSNIYKPELVKADIERIKDQVDLVIVSMHWGVEYVNTPNQEQKTIANYLSTLGVDIVIGHHPHVIQPIELINETLVFYSLGNFLSGQDKPDRLVGMIGSLDVTITEKDGIKTKQISNINSELVYTYHRGFTNYKIIPFSKLTNEIFSGYTNYYDKYQKILTSMNDTVSVTKLGE